MKEIVLTQGQVALVSDEDYEWLSRWKWSAWWNKATRSYYARRGYRTPGGKTRTVYMHRAIMEEPEGLIVDHININSLDNQRHNLRTCTPSQSACNRRIQSNNSYGIPGMRYDKRDGRWRPVVTVQGHTICLGGYASKEEAVVARLNAEKKYYREFVPEQRRQQGMIE